MSSFEPPAPPPPPPPPPGGYGGPPPPGGFEGYGAPPPGGPEQPWDLGAAVGYGWTKFQANAGQIIVAALALIGSLLAVGVIYVVLNATLFSTSVECGLRGDGSYGCDTDGPGFLSRLVISGLFTALFVVVLQVVGAGLIRASLKVTEGEPFRTSDVFDFSAIGPIVVTGLLVGAGTFVGTILCFLPGIIFAFASSYAMYFVIDKGLEPVAAIRASIDLVRTNLANTIVWWLISGIIGAIGLAVCLVGGLVSYPVALLGTAYTYKKLTGQPVAP